jgi:hypothetical protein
VVKERIVEKVNLRQVQVEQVVKDPREHFVKGDGFEDAPKDTG